ncbi:hypothetical protein PsYK624_157380 [Phanerochaete sordida]|uniref:F-box domain-containing protein n=1 Tax=Phanerochaete sordida TaxID=48140 RepID=A0A9P3LM92_9APHY|nr:hypothetical protein PsYK624_157380 [Phanerochaete sordida]
MPSDRLPLSNSQNDEVKLPQELVDKVIGELHGDTESLKRCSLVAKSWLPASSALLLRRVRWPPCGNRGSGCARHSSTHSCTYTLPSKNSFALCLEILSSSPRLQSSVRELACLPPHGLPGRTDETHSTLGLITFVGIVDHLPHLEVVDIGCVTLRAGSPPSSARTGRALKKLSISNTGDRRWLWEFFPLLSIFARVQHLVFAMYDHFPSSWSSDPPASKPEVEILECSLIQDHPSTSYSDSFYAGLEHHLDLQTLRQLTSDTVQPGFARIISSAPSLESLSLRTGGGRGRPLNFDTIPPRLSSVDVCGTFPIFQGSVGFPGTNNLWIQIWDTLEPITALPLRSVLVDISVKFFPLPKDTRRTLYSSYETMLSEITDWHTPVRVLDGFERLESITFGIRFSVWKVGSPIYHPLRVHGRHLAAMREAVEKGLPRRYADLVHVRAAES